MKGYNVYVAACGENGGIYHYKMTDKMIFCDKTEIDRPMYLAAKNDRLYVLLRQPFENCNNSGLTVFDINKDGSLGKSSEIISTGGECACHLYVDDDVYAVNYLSGSVIKMPDKLDVRTGKGPNKVRQDKSHTHFVCASPDNKYIFATNLGADEVIVYDKNLNEVSTARVPDGHGARHLAFYHDNKTVFCVNELMSTVTVFTYDDGTLIPGETVSVLPEDFHGENTAAAIRVRGNCVYVSNRGHNSVSVLKYENKVLRLINTFPCGGDGPRDFDFVGDTIIVTNQNSNNITIFDETGRKNEQEFYAEDPLCVISIKEK